MRGQVERARSVRSYSCIRGGWLSYLRFFRRPFFCSAVRRFVSVLGGMSKGCCTESPKRRTPRNAWRKTKSDHGSPISSAARAMEHSTREKSFRRTEGRIAH